MGLNPARKVIIKQPWMGENHRTPFESHGPWSVFFWYLKSHSSLGSRSLFPSSGISYLALTPVAGTARALQGTLPHSSASGKALEVPLGPYCQESGLHLRLVVGRKWLQRGLELPWQREVKARKGGVGRTVLRTVDFQGTCTTRSESGCTGWNLIFHMFQLSSIFPLALYF